MPPAVRLRLAGAGVVVCGFAATVASMVANGGVLTRGMLERTWQLSDTVLLRDDPFGTVWYLHVQPPLYNLVVGGVLRWSPFAPIGTLEVLYLAALLATALLLWDLLCSWHVHPLAAALPAVVVVAEPDLLRTTVWNSYEIPVAFLLVTALWCLRRNLAGAGGRWLVAASAALTAAALTRSLVHPLVVVALVGLGGWFGRATRRALVVSLALPVLLVGGWMLRASVLFDTFTTSSWTGFNLQRGITATMSRAEVEEAVAAGSVSPNALRQPWQDLSAYERAPCRPDGRHPSLSESHRLDTGATNLNDACFLPVYARAERDARTLVRLHPGRYVSSRQVVLPTAYSVARVGLADSVPSFTDHVRPSRTWMDAFADLWQLPVHRSVDMSGWNLPLIGQPRLPYEMSVTLAVASAVLLVRAFVAAWRLARHLRSRGSGDEAVAGEVLWLVAGVLVVLVGPAAALVEFGENGRFRASVDPILITFVAGGAWRCASRLRRGAA